jgi:hypothetical protein
MIHMYRLQQSIHWTDRSLNIRYKEHIRIIKYNREESAFATDTNIMEWAM